MLQALAAGGALHSQSGLDEQRVVYFMWLETGPSRLMIQRLNSYYEIHVSYFAFVLSTQSYAPNFCMK